MNKLITSVAAGSVMVFLTGCTVSTVSTQPGYSSTYVYSSGYGYPYAGYYGTGYYGGRYYGGRYWGNRYYGNRFGRWGINRGYGVGVGRIGRFR